MKSHPGIQRVGAVAVFVLLFLAASLYVTPRPPAMAATPQAPATDSDLVVLEVRDTIVLAEDSIYWLSVYLTNPGEYVGGFEMTLFASRFDLAHLHDTATVDTLIICSDSVTCDTSIIAGTDAVLDLSGSPVADWDYVGTNALSQGVLRIVALADLPGGSSPAPLAPGSAPKLLLRVALDRGLDEAVFDTLQDRSTTWTAAGSATAFSDPLGNTIGRRDTIICVDPPTCTALDTTTYDANILIGGTVTVAVDCASGDVDGSGNINAADIIRLVNYVFKTGPPPACTGITGDVDCAGGINSADIIYLVNYTLKSGPPPCPE